MSRLICGIIIAGARGFSFVAKLNVSKPLDPCYLEVELSVLKLAVYLKFVRS